MKRIVLLIAVVFVFAGLLAGTAQAAVKTNNIEDLAKSQFVRGKALDKSTVRAVPASVGKTARHQAMAMSTFDVEFYGGENCDGGGYTVSFGGIVPFNPWGAVEVYVNGSEKPYKRIVPYGEEVFPGAVADADGPRVRVDESSSSYFYGSVTFEEPGNISLKLKLWVDGDTCYTVDYFAEIYEVYFYIDDVRVTKDAGLVNMRYALSAPFGFKLSKIKAVDIYVDGLDNGFEQVKVRKVTDDGETYYATIWINIPVSQYTGQLAGKEQNTFFSFKIVNKWMYSTRSIWYWSLDED